MPMMPVRGAAALDKGLALFIALTREGQAPLSAASRAIGIPHSTAQRLVAAFVRRGLLVRVGPGRYAAGCHLASLAATHDRNAVLATVGRPFVRRLAREARATAHLGVLDGDMITYLIKEHGGGGPVLSAERSQLEAYCTGVGKMLLASLPSAAQDAYLAAGPFIALTDATMTDPALLRAEFARIRAQGYALDQAELQQGLFCVAVPVHGAGGQVLAAISVSGFTPAPAPPERLLACAQHISRRFGGGEDN